MKRELLALSVVVAFASVTLHARANRLGYTDEVTGLDIGKGVSGVDYGNPIAACVETSSSDISSISASAAKLTISIVYNARQFAEALHIDTQAKASILSTASASGHFNLDQQYGDDKTAYDVIIESSQQNPSLTFSGSPRWRPHYQTMFDTGKLEQIRKECGDRYVQTVYNGSSIFSVLHVSQDANKFHINVSTGGSAQFDIGVVGANAKIGTDIDIKSAHQSGNIRVTSISLGFGGMRDAASLLAIVDSDSLTEIVSKTVSGLNHLTPVGQAVAYELTPYPGMSERHLSTDSIASSLSTIRLKYMSAAVSLENSNELLNGLDGRSTELNPVEHSRVKAYVVRLRPYAIKLATKFGECARALDPADPSCDDLDEDMPVPPDVALLTPEMPPVVAGLSIVLDNYQMLSSTQVSAILKVNYAMLKDASLLGMVRLQFPNAQSADLILLINSPYYASISSNFIELNEFAGGNLITHAVDFARVRNFEFEPSWKVPEMIRKQFVPIPVMHADDKNRCKMTAVIISPPNNIGSGFDETCVNLDIVRLYESAAASTKTFLQVACDRQMPDIWHVGQINGNLTDRFNMSNSVAIAMWSYDYWKGTPGACILHGQLLLSAPDGSYVGVVAKQEVFH